MTTHAKTCLTSVCVTTWIRTAVVTALAIGLGTGYPVDTSRAALAPASRADVCEESATSQCIAGKSAKPGTPSMITPLTGVFTNEPQFEWRRGAHADSYLLSITELNAEGAIIATFSRNITHQVRCIDEICRVSSTSLGFRLQSDAARFKYRLIASNDYGSSATSKTTVTVQ